jgi:hypothetical protein
MQGKFFAASMLLVLFFFSLSSVAQAEIFACDANGVEKSVFYTNETVYVTGNITYADNTSVLYVMPNSDSWVNNTLLSNSTLTKSVTSNSTGGIAPVAVWTTPVVGTYDMIIDINGNTYYDAGIDFIDSATAVGFEVKQTPIPTLALSLGPNTPTAHTMDASNTNQNVMMQFKATAGTYEDVTINSIGIVAEGTGDDRIVVFKIYEDANANGVVDSTDNLLGFGQYSLDDGFNDATLDPAPTIAANTSKYFIIAYTFMGSTLPTAGQTFSVSISIVTAKGVNSKTAAVISGITVKSATLTIAGATTTTTTTTTTTSTTTTTQPITTTTTTTTTQPPPTPGIPLDTTTLLLIVAVVVIVIVLVVYFLKFRREPTNYSYEYKV